MQGKNESSARTWLFREHDLWAASGTSSVAPAQVLRALDRALLKIGFQHRDTNAHNVMEHWLDEERAGPVHDTPPKIGETELGKK